VTDSVTKAVRQLTEMGVGHLEDFEILLIMSRQPDGDWSAARVVASSTITLAAAETALARLAKRKIVDLVQATPPSYRLGGRIDVAQLVQLRNDHERDRTLVVNTFFKCNLDTLRHFASAFRIWKS